MSDGRQYTCFSHTMNSHSAQEKRRLSSSSQTSQLGLTHHASPVMSAQNPYEPRGSAPLSPEQVTFRTISNFLGGITNGQLYGVKFRRYQDIIGMIRDYDRNDPISKQSLSNIRYRAKLIRPLPVKAKESIAFISYVQSRFPHFDGAEFFRFSGTYEVYETAKTRHTVRVAEFLHNESKPLPSAAGRNSYGDWSNKCELHIGSGSVQGC